MIWGIPRGTEQGTLPGPTQPRSKAGAFSLREEMRRSPGVGDGEEEAAATMGLLAVCAFVIAGAMAIFGFGDPFVAFAVAVVFAVCAARGRGITNPRR
jgi:hypothetical protein